MTDVAFSTLDEVIEYVKFIAKDTVEQETDGEHTIDFTTVQGKFFWALLKPVAQTCFLNQEQDRTVLINQAFITTCNEFYLKERFAKIFALTQGVATYSKGALIIQGTLGASIQQNTEFYIDSRTFASDNLVYVTEYTIPYIALEEISGKIVVTMSQDFDLSSNMKMYSIAGGYIASDKTITVTSTNKFSFDKISGVDITAQTGNIIFRMARVEVTSVYTGAIQNVEAGEKLTLTNPVVSLDEFGYVTYDRITGGVDAQSIEDFRQQLLDIYQNLPQGWSGYAVEYLIKRYDNNKYDKAKIFIPRAENTTGVEDPGFTTIYILKEDNTKLSNTEKIDLKAFLISQDLVYPIRDSLNLVDILDPDLVNINIQISITSINKNTLDMRTALTDLESIMQEDKTLSWFRQTLELDYIKSLIKNTVDKNGVNIANDFTLVNPTTNTNLLYDQFPIISVEVI